MAGYWLIKSEPSTYSFDTLVTDGRTVWDGVRNYEARNNLRAMSKGDLLFFYHSNEGKEIVGVARVASEHYRDPSTDEDWSVVDVEPVQPLRRSVSLATLKADPVLCMMHVVRKSRISVTRVTEAEFRAVLALANTRLLRT